MCLCHNVFDCAIPIPEKVRVNAWTARRVTKLLTQPHYIMLAITDDSNIRVESVLLKSISPGKIEASSHCNKAFASSEAIEMTVMSSPNSLYPSLEDI